MPNIRASNSYFCRISYQHAELEGPLNALAAWVDMAKVIVATHKGEKQFVKDDKGEFVKDDNGNKQEIWNEHIHMCVELTTTIQKQSFDVRLKKLFNLAGGNKDFSSKVWDKSLDACSYLFHEPDAQVVLNRGHTDEDIALYKRMNERVQTIVKQNKEAGANKSINRIIELVGVDCTHDAILHAIHDDVRAGKMYHPGFRLVAMVEEVYIKTRSDTSYERFKEVHFANLKNKYMWT